MQALPLDQITLDPDLQSRVEINQDLCQDYAEAVAAGAQFPRVIVFFDGATYWLADGYHRWHAHKVNRTIDRNRKSSVSGHPVAQPPTSAAQDQRAVGAGL